MFLYIHCVFVVIAIMYAKSKIIVDLGLPAQSPENYIDGGRDVAD